jgi:hypothetical protein
MNHSQHNSIVNFIWGIADDVLRDVYVRGKYRDVTRFAGIRNSKTFCSAPPPTLSAAFWRPSLPS